MEDQHKTARKPAKQDAPPTGEAPGTDVPPASVLDPDRTEDNKAAKRINGDDSLGRWSSGWWLLPFAVLGIGFWVALFLWLF